MASKGQQNDNKKVTGLPASGRPANRRIHQGGGKVKTDKQGHIQPESTTGK
jgi:hypothetical protein